MNLEHLLKVALEASVKAGNAIMTIYKSDDFDVQLKSDESPLTKADLAAHNIIVNLLKATDIPVLSEEDANIDYSIRSKWDAFWLVDPLDGTKEFIKKNDEFTVNIALIVDKIPVLGVVYLPVFNSVYFGAEGMGSFYNSEAEISKIDSIITNAIQLPKPLPEIYTVVGSRSHMNEDTQAYFSNLEKEHGTIEIISKGSSLKLCMVAEGSAHEYPRFGPTMEWDTGAGHAVALYSGAKVTKTDKTSPLTYNKENLLNPYFIVAR
jgi:3'(2'), 5'-bisphosphate nucleotidase